MDIHIKNIFLMCLFLRPNKWIISINLYLVVNCLLHLFFSAFNLPNDLLHWGCYFLTWVKNPIRILWEKNNIFFRVCFRAILKKEFRTLMKGMRGNVSSFANIMMELKKCANHAHLVVPPLEELPYKEKLQVGCLLGVMFMENICLDR